MATRPARVSETPFIIWNCCAPVNQNNPCLPSVSAMISMWGSNWEACCISLIKTGGPNRWRKRVESSMARVHKVGSSSVTYR